MQYFVPDLNDSLSKRHYSLHIVLVTESVAQDALTGRIGIKILKIGESHVFVFGKRFLIVWMTVCF